MTETRYRTSHPLLIATPALQAWADEHGDHWLIDAVASHLFAGRDARRAQADPITFWTVTVRDDATEREPMAVLRGTDGGVISILTVASGDRPLVWPSTVAVTLKLWLPSSRAVSIGNDQAPVVTSAVTVPSGVVLPSR